MIVTRKASENQKFYNYCSQSAAYQFSLKNLKSKKKEKKLKKLLKKNCIHAPNDLNNFSKGNPFESICMKAHIIREKPADVSDTKLGTWAKDCEDLKFTEIYRI